MKFNLRKFATVFILLNAVLFMGGCTASWIGAIQALMPAINAAISAVFAFIAALEGKVIPENVMAAIQKIQDDISASLTNLSTLIADATANASATVVQEIEAVANSIVSNLNSILSGLSVTDPSTIGKITNLVGLAVAALEAILAILPLAMKAFSTTMSAKELESADKSLAHNFKATHKAIKDAYHVTVSTPTVNPEVNLALATLPSQLP